MTEYPATLLRGLSAEDWVADGIVTATAFQIKFEPKFMRNGWAAQSVGWEDDGSVVNLMLQQKKEGEDRYQFRFGLARFHRESIDRLIKSPAFQGILSYDREPLGENPYHGNLLVSPTLTSAQRKLLLGVIAAQFSEIIPRE